MTDYDYAKFTQVPYLNPANSYWIVGDDETQVYSSAKRKLVAVDDKDFLEWKKSRGPLRIASMEDLKKVFAAEGLDDGDSQHHG